MEGAGEQALAPLCVGHDGGVEPVLLGRDLDDLLVDIAEAELIGYPAPDALPAGSRRVRDRHDSRRHIVAESNQIEVGLQWPISTRAPRTRRR